MLHIRHLELINEAGKLVSDFSLEIFPGEVVALTGKSGSGKTSIANAILGSLQAGVQHSYGTIEWKGQPAHLSLPHDRLQWPMLRGRYIGWIQQDVFGMYDPVLKMGRQMSMLISERSGVTEVKANDALKDILQRTGMEDIPRVLSSYPHQLSGGQLQRCQIAMTVAMQPQLIIADEPTSAIDKINQKTILNILRDLSDAFGIALLCITHDPFVVQSLADREIRLTNDPPVRAIHSNDVVDMNEIVLQARNLTFIHHYGGMMTKKGAGVEGISFGLKQGSCLGIIGKSGSGKSTLAQILCGLITPSSGTLEVNGKKIDFKSRAGLRKLRANVQLVMQDGRGSLHPHFSIRTILNEVIKFNQIREKDISSALLQVGLDDSLLDRPASQLSGGECLRVSIARALLMDPAVLICDESTAALDPNARDGILNLLKDLIDQNGLSLVMISHDYEAVIRMADEIMLLDQGSVMEQGLLDIVKKQPESDLGRAIFNTDATFSQQNDLYNEKG